MGEEFIYAFLSILSVIVAMLLSASAALFYQSKKETKWTKKPSR